MTAVYTNKFTLQLSDMVRIVFIDEHAAIAKGLPMHTSTSAEVVMTLDNLKAFVDLAGRLLKEHIP
jgi:hypothetical protein